MTALEMSDEFDILYQNINSNQAPGLNEYEKSLFLTRAQEDIVRAYFNPVLNKFQEGFDGSARRQVDFSNLITTWSHTVSPADTNYISIYPYKGGVGVVKFLAPDIMVMLNETVIVNRGNTLTPLLVVPISFEELGKQLDKPYPRPTKRKAWRLSSEYKTDSSKETEVDANVLLIAGGNDSFNYGNTATRYTLRYIRVPKPIIIENLSGVEINGCQDKADCELDASLHHDIVTRAVEIAKAVMAGDLTSFLGIGLSSQTNLGILGQSSKDNQ